MYYKIIIFICLVLITGCSVRTNPHQQDLEKIQSELISNTPVIDEYTDREIKPVIQANIQTDGPGTFLLIVNTLMDENKGISKNQIPPMDFMKVSFISQKKYIAENAWYCFLMPEKNRETIRILHNKYMLDDASGIFFGPTANDIVYFRFAFGCTHYARVFMAVVKSLNLIDDPGSMRYVISCEADSYNEFIRNKRKKMINGHQFVIVKIDDQWYGINTNRENDFIKFPSDFDPDMDITLKNYPVSFPGIPGKTFLLRKIGKDYNDNCGDYTLERLKNIYISGDPEGDSAKWAKFE